MILKSFLRNIVFSISLATAADVFAVTDPVLPLRACLDKFSNNVTIFFTPQSDGCGSFTEYRLYGREDAINPFILLATNAMVGSNQMSANLPNRKKWEFFIVTRFACNGTDTLKSVSIFLDDQPPALLNIDSVSVDLVTQRVIAGWQNAPEADVMGYSVFKVDAGTGNNILIKDTNATGYAFNTSTFNSSNTGNRIAIAVFDSCTNGGIISNFHSPVLLRYDMAANANYRCDKQFRFTWSQYIGWTTDHHDIWYKDDVNNIWTYSGSVPGTQLNYTFNIPNLNRAYTFYVRAFRNATGNQPSSSSNTITVNLPDFPVPSNNNIGHVSVIENGSIEVTGTWEAPTSAFRAELQESLNGTNWTIAASLNNNQTTFRRTYTNKTTNSISYSYRILIYNPCNQVVSTSTTHSSMVLYRTAYDLNWNTYGAYAPNADEGVMERDKQSFTWNAMIASTSPYILTDTTKALCYRIASYKTSGPARVDTAYSNEICLRVFDTTLVPTAFNPDGPNKFFKVTNPNLSPGNATLYIFNRWGQKLFEGEALTGWDGNYMDQPVITGIYVWQVRIFRIEKRETLNGTLMLLR